MHGSTVDVVAILQNRPSGMLTLFAFTVWRELVAHKGGIARRVRASSAATGQTHEWSEVPRGGSCNTPLHKYERVKGRK